MTPYTRRQALTLAGGAALLSACTAEAPRAQPPSADRHVQAPSAAPSASAAVSRSGRLFADTAAGLAVADLLTGRVRATYPGAVAEARWARIYQLDRGRLRTYQAGDGTLIDDLPAGGGQIKAVSADLVVIGPPPGPRTRTTLTLAGDGRPRTLRLAGNIEPEAFSPDGATLYVLDRLPPAAPDRYRVRACDLARGRMTALSTRDKQQVPPGQEEEMRGQGRQAVLDPVQNILYTLYTHQDAHLHTRDLAAGTDLSPGVHAFVHVLHLDQRWAYCLDLPAPFGLGPPEAHTLALAGTSLYVFDASTGRALLASTENLTISRSALLGKAPAGEAFAAAGGGHLYVAAGTRLTVADARTLAPQAARDLPGPARGLAHLPGQLLAGAADQVLRLDPATGADLSADLSAGLGAVPLPGLRALRHAETTAG
ncbi:hypothetical protein SAMN05444920_120133 [Nonomuraea solani]|uniref:DNA-binding beta-propeller fold protein YncE n=1 Tax=Nonomuraea solani TaxID=1144553 RepID=A0A1H6EX22_9ACTN|nr:hypothetical protein [Nonomuraea solani]SEH01429.1 hypothetical protein SAMN05444920_120133 [Nonomuraea solani]